MSNIPVPPLIPLPNSTRPNTYEAKEDLFATLFSPATPRTSPAASPPPEEEAGTRPLHRHSRSSSSTSTDSEFGSFVSVPTTEDPLAEFVSASDSVPFTPVQDLEFLEDAKAQRVQGKTGLLEELLENENDPFYFLRNAQSASQSTQSNGLSGESTPGQAPASPKPDAMLVDQPLLSLTSTLSSEQDRAALDLLSVEPSNLDWKRASSSLERSRPPLLTPSPPESVHHTPRVASPPRQSSVLKELLDHQDGALHFRGSPSASASARTSRTTTPHPPVNEEPLVDLDSFDEEPNYRSRSLSRHPLPDAASTDSTDPVPSLAPVRSPSLPPTPMKMSMPEVQRTQSFFMPSSLSTPSSFSTKWVSSLLSRPAPPPPPPPPPVVPDPAGSVLHSQPLKHGTPFAAHPYVPPSGAPGFAGDRTWDKGFQYDKENVERASVRLVGRKDSTTPLLTVGLADKIRLHLPPLKRIPKSWTLLYSLDQHGISLNTLYTRCEAHVGGALILMKDSNDAVFGAWIGDGIRPSKGAYYGSGESFLWRQLSGEKLRVFKWSGKNDYVALCEPEYISFGGGDGHYGLYLDETLSDGSSAHCPTFDNEALCSAGPRKGDAVTFECVGLEVWGIS